MKDDGGLRIETFNWMQPFLLTIGSFLLTIELLCSQWRSGVFCLQLELF